MPYENQEASRALVETQMGPVGQWVEANDVVAHSVSSLEAMPSSFARTIDARLAAAEAMAAALENADEVISQILRDNGNVHISHGSAVVRADKALALLLTALRDVGEAWKKAQEA